MRKEIRDLIKRAYPTNRYMERNKALLDRYAKKGTAEAIGRQIVKIPEIDSYFRAAEGGYDIHHMFRLCHPVGAREKLDAVESKRERVRVYRSLPSMYSLMEIGVSQLGPYYRYFWNYYKVIRGRTEVFYSDDPPTKLWQTVEKKVNAILRDFGLSRLTPRELGEIVDWVDPGESIVPRGIVTVSNCLFSEIM